MNLSLSNGSIAKQPPGSWQQRAEAYCSEESTANQPKWHRKRKLPATVEKMGTSCPMIKASPQGLTRGPDPKPLPPNPGLSMATEEGLPTTPQCASHTGNPRSPKITAFPAVLQFFLNRNPDPELIQGSSQEPLRTLPEG